MLVEVDEGSGVVRLDDEGVAALTRPATTDGASDPAVRTLLGSGRYDAALAALREPVVTMDLVVAASGSRLTHTASVVPETAAVLLGVRPGLHQLMAMPPAYLTAALVRLTGLEPRRVAERTDVPFPQTRLGELVAEDPEQRTATLAEVGADLAWRLEVRWATGSQQLTATDGRDGVRIAGPGEDVLRAVTNTTVYRILSTTLPWEALPEPVG